MRLNEEFYLCLSLFPVDLGERVDFFAGIFIDELDAVCIEVDFEQFFVELNEVEQSRVQPHLD